MSGCPDYLPSEGGSAISTLGEAENRHIGKPEAAIKPLEVAFRAYDHDLRQIWREGQIAIFERSLPGREPHEFELVVIRTQKESTLPNGSVLPAREAYPGSSQWGERGWSFPIRNRQLAFELARRMAASPCSYARWMRASLSHLKDHGRLPTLSEHQALVAANPSFGCRCNRRPVMAKREAQP